ncbi:putative transcriptional regulator, AsnC family [Desulfosarcina cetonica]|uniref:siroheme decarboxylase subunit alpha n=1 Tax=Desulfosarcina cetonica TaxID=90730 RepID=UPI000AC584D9|nr:AsnC family transcriptional regulator [Desulfosarcina cetonica]VTR69822.1 putative transcriptional regulator, AsnC family [Desulfosarcina cetonica]
MKGVGMEIVLDELDKAILNRIQTRFPLSPQPFAVIGEELQASEAVVIERVARLKESGLIRRIGGNFVPGKVGFVSTLCAAKVPEEKLELFARTVNTFPGVTHNYLRENAYNVWFTFIAPSMTCIVENLSMIARKTGVTRILNLPATHVFKIKAKFDV